MSSTIKTSLTVKTTRATRPIIDGCVDSLAPDGIHGWAIDRTQPGEPVQVLLLHQGRLLAEATADKFRQDLLDAGHATGRHGFVIPLPPGLPSLPSLRLHIHEAATGRELPRSPLTHTSPQTFDTDARHALLATVDAGLAHARTPAELDDLAAFLLAQFDRAFARRQALAETAAARRAAFDALLTTRDLSAFLQDSAAATLDRYQPLHFPPAEHPDTSVIIPVHNHFAATHRCLASLLAHLPRTSFEIILVDDASTDETIFAGPLLSGAIRLHRFARNEGFVAATNAGAALARGKLLMFLNNDTVATPGWLDELAATFARDPTAGIVGSKLLSPSGHLQECGAVVFSNGDAWNWGRGEDSARPEFSYLRQADYVSGAALMLPRALWDELGGFDSLFAPGYYEDNDLCFRARARGRPVAVQPLSQLIHHEGTTSGTDEAGAGMKRFQPINRRRFLARWSAEIARQPELGDRNAPYHHAGRRALFIDECVPTPDQDAGSWAATEHIRALQRLGYAVSFAASDRLEYSPKYTPLLQREGVHCFYAPYQHSIEQVLREATAPYDLVYLHRLANATRYTALIRDRMPGAHILYNVADLHHIRVQRQADFEHDPVLLETAGRLRDAELAAIRNVDAVLTHSEAEAILLRGLVPTSVTALPWTVPPRPVRRPFAARTGLAFIGGYRHKPNVDAALHLARDIMPLVWQRLPSATLHLVGSNMPDSILRLATPRIRIRGQIPDLDDLFAEIRLTIAPLRYGAGLKGKVLASLAAGIPCVLTPTAAEGMELPGPLLPFIAATPAEIAAAVITLHEDPTQNQATAEAGLAWITETCNPTRIDTLLQEACASF